MYRRFDIDLLGFLLCVLHVGLTIVSPTYVYVVCALHKLSDVVGTVLRNLEEWG